MQYVHISMYMHILRVPFLADIHHMCTVKCIYGCPMNEISTPDPPLRQTTVCQYALLVAHPFP